MNRTGQILFGATVGGFIGYIVGAMIADIYFPEYYTEEELTAIMEERAAQYASDNDLTVDSGDKPIERKYTDYTQYYKESEKPPLTSLLPAPDEDDMDEDYIPEEDEDGDRIDPDGLYDYEEEEVPYLDMEMLSEYEPDEYLEVRDEAFPHVILQTEYEQNVDEHHTAELTFWAGDEVLTDAQNRPVQNTFKTLGDYALDNFGAFSDDENVVYVRNPQLRALYKVTSVDQSYEEFVSGKPRQQDRIVVRNVFDEYNNDLPPGAPRGPVKRS